MNRISLSGLPLGIPLYQEVKRKIMESLRDGEWKPGEIIPSEKYLAARFGVSIGTVRKAVDELAAENILVRHQGRGTFVASHTDNRYVFGFFHIVGQDGRKEYPTVELIELGSAKADAHTAQRLGLRTGSRIVRLTNRLMLAGKPVVVDDISLPDRLFPKLTKEVVRSRPGTLYQLYQDNFAIAVLRTEERLRATGADERLAGLLGVAAGTPLLHVIRVAFTFGDQPVELRHSYVSTANHEYFAGQSQ